MRDWRAAPLAPATRALAEFVEQVALRPHDSSREAVERVRAAGFSDAAIHDAVQVTAYFSYINRVADALGIKPEPGMPRWGQEAGSR